MPHAQVFDQAACLLVRHVCARRHQPAALLTDLEYFVN